MKNIDLGKFALNNASRKGDEYSFDGEGGELSLCFEKGCFCGIGASEDDYLVMDVTNLTTACCAIKWGFWENPEARGAELSIKMGLLPGIKTRLALPLSVCEGKQLFLDRTPGKLKSVTQGHPVRLGRVCRFTISNDPAPEQVRLRIENAWLSDTEPEYPLLQCAVVDSMGQKSASDWPGKAHSLQQMVERMKQQRDEQLPPIENRSIYGGWLEKSFPATGFFALHHDGERWYLADPEGYAFFSMGLDCVSLNVQSYLSDIKGLSEQLPEQDNSIWAAKGDSNYESDNYNWIANNLYRAHGDDLYNVWCELTARRMRSWGFNTVAAWSDLEFAERKKMPYVVINEGEYPSTKNCIFRDFPDVFSPEFEQNSERWAQLFAARRDDPYLVGYFMSNEPHWAFIDNPNIAAITMEQPSDFYTKHFIIDSLREKYRTIEAQNAAWGSSFEGFEQLSSPFEIGEFSKAAYDDLYECSAQMIRQYVKLPAQAVRRVDPNHLNLGIRFAWLSSDILASGSEYVDIFSFNCYKMDPTASIEEFSRMSGKPVMIGEYHFGALDRGLDATGIRGVCSQQQRGVAFRRYNHAAAAHPMCVGAHYFTLYDQAYLGRFDGENYQIGLLDICDKPYEEFCEQICRTHRELYDVMSGRQQPTEQTAQEIRAIFI